MSHNCLKEMEGIYAVWFILEATQETMKEDTFIRGTPQKPLTRCASARSVNIDICNWSRVDTDVRFD